jgi:Lactate racemase N-terminal domain
MTDHFPKMLELRQNYPAPRQLDLPDLIRKQFTAAGLLAKVSPGMKIAVGVGSRGIANIQPIAKTVLGILIDAGAQPFIIPAMGSHGGATAEGQEKVLAEYGITRESMGVPIESSMDVRRIGATPHGREVVLSVPALQADGIIVINRVKPHTDFSGDLGSGIQKMLTIGLGKQIGAANAHAAASRLGYETVIRSFAKVIMAEAPVLGGVAIIEDQHHQTADVRVIETSKIPEEEGKLLAKARSLMAGLPFDEIDLLIVDQIGKEISGAGMDTNVIGRGIFGYDASLKSNGAVKPHIYRIFARDLTPTTKGNGVGVGLADFTTSRLVKALDPAYTYMNAITSLGILVAKIPIYYDTDCEVLRNAFRSLVPDSPEKLRVVRIVNTLNLDRMLVSQFLAEQVQGRAGLTLFGTAKEIEFDAAGNLLPF